MQLLDSEQLEYAFQSHDIGHEMQARRFYADIWALIQAAEKAPDDGPELGGHIRALRTRCRDYFKAMRDWEEQESKHTTYGEICHPSRNNKREAKSVLALFERQFFRYALCYLELNRALVRMRTKLSAFTQALTLPSADVLEINHGTGAILMRAHQERRGLMQTRRGLSHMRKTLSGLDPVIELLGARLPALLGHNDGDRQLTLFKGALRQERFEEAVAIAASWPFADLAEPGLEIAAYVRRNASVLKVKDGLILHSGELGLIETFLRGDEAKVDAFLEKLNVPYMVHQYRNLIRLGYALGRIGSLEGLIIQHAKLLSLAARPHGDPERARMQEQTILSPTRVLLSGKFKTLSPIFDQLETSVAILEKLFALTRAYEPFIAPKS